MKHSLHAWTISCAFVAVATVATAQDSLLPLPATPPLAYYQQPYQPRAPQYQPQPSAAAYRVASVNNLGAYDQAYDWSRAQAIQAGNASSQHTVYDGAVWNEALAGNCASCGTGTGQSSGSLWSVQARALLMTRVTPDAFHFNFESTTPAECILRSDDPGLNWRQGGVDLTLERRIGCNGRLQLNYWTLAPSDDQINVSIPGLVLNTTINLNPVAGVSQLLLAGSTLDTYFDGAGEQLLRRNNEIHNVEVNYTHDIALSGPGRPFGFSALAGFRYFRFDEGLQFGSVQNGFQFGDNGGINEAYYDVDTLNSLYGFQAGGRIERFLFGRFRVYTDAKAGVFYNNAEQQSQVFRGDGAQAFDLASSEDVFSFIAQVEVGVDMEITQWLRGNIGYRALGVSGVALSDQQIPAFIHDSGSILDVNTAGSLVLHGGYAGFTVLW